MKVFILLVFFWLNWITLEIKKTICIEMLKHEYYILNEIDILYPIKDNHFTYSIKDIECSFPGTFITIAVMAAATIGTISTPKRQVISSISRVSMIWATKQVVMIQGYNPVFPIGTPLMKFVALQHFTICFSFNWFEIVNDRSHDNLDVNCIGWNYITIRSITWIFISSKSFVEYFSD